MLADLLLLEQLRQEDLEDLWRAAGHTLPPPTHRVLFLDGLRGMLLQRAALANRARQWIATAAAYQRIALDLEAELRRLSGHCAGLEAQIAALVRSLDEARERHGDDFPGAQAQKITP